MCMSVWVYSSVLGLTKKNSSYQDKKNVDGNNGLANRIVNEEI